jgi:hypothetical protein
VAERSGDTAFDCGQSFQSGVALRFPPQSKICRFPLEGLPPNSRLPMKLNFREGFPNMR